VPGGLAGLVSLETSQIPSAVSHRARGRHAVYDGVQVDGNGLPRFGSLSSTGVGKQYPGQPTGSPIDEPAKALKAGVTGLPGGENMVVSGNGTARHFTTREAARLQALPDTFTLAGSWSQAMRQLGNAVRA